MLSELTNTITVNSFDCDMFSMWKPSSILGVMQQMAGNHAELLGVGRGELLKEDVVWVLTRIQVQMDKWPVWGDKITITTFPMKNRRCFFPRYFIFKNEQGEEIGRAGTIWTLMNIRERKMASPDCTKGHIPDNLDKQPPIGMPPAVAQVEGSAKSQEIIPCFNDLDMNAHVNNTKYMDWCTNALGIEVLKGKRLTEFVINYNHEVLADESIRTELILDEQRFSFSGFSGGNRSFDVGGVLVDR